MNTLVNNLLVPLVTIVGLIVLVALHDISANVAIPVIVGLAGVHTGANLSNPAPTSAETPATGGDPYQ